MANNVCDVALVDGPLATECPSEDAGAVVEFFGNVRPLENGRPILALEYEAHIPMAEHQLRQVAETAAKKFSLLAITLHHRIGRVAAGETSLFLRVASAHRRAAFAASIFIVDELKKRVPIWKKPVFVNSTCHPEPRKLSGSKDPVDFSLEVSPRDPSTALGMTEAGK